MRAWTSARGRPSAQAAGMTPATGPDGERVAELERLAPLHDRGSLTDEEFAAEKATLKAGS